MKLTSVNMTPRPSQFDPEYQFILNKTVACLENADDVALEYLESIDCDKIQCVADGNCISISSRSVEYDDETLDLYVVDESNILGLLSIIYNTCRLTYSTSAGFIGLQLRVLKSVLSGVVYFNINDKLIADCIQYVIQGR